MLYFQVDIYGACGTRISLKDLSERLNKDYLFYLSFENSFCKDYITEKFFSYAKYDVVLVVRGGANYDRLLPNDTFIDASKFKTARELTEYLLNVSRSEEIYTKYLKNKDKYEVLFDAQKTQSVCKLCSMVGDPDLNRKWYSDLKGYIYNDQCFSANDLM